MSDSEYVTVANLARQAGMHPFSTKRAVINAGLSLVSVRVSGRKPQSALAKDDAESFLASRSTPGVIPEDLQNIQTGVGGVYLVLPDPEMRPQRVKVGWAAGFRERLAAHKVIAPELVILRLYATDAPWTEAMAIKVLGELGKRITREIYDIDAIDRALAIMDQQFQNIRVGVVSGID